MRRKLIIPAVAVLILAVLGWTFTRLSSSSRDPVPRLVTLAIDVTPTPTPGYDFGDGVPETLPLGSAPERLTKVDNLLYFSAKDDAHGREAVDLAFVEQQLALPSRLVRHEP